ncbi:MAG: TIGR01906 family membrane protein [Clostridiales bacterium]|nr:TIGR01906 family membrane protein [Clostridiales bacterium]
MGKQKYICISMGIIFSISLMAVLFLTSIELIAFNKNFYIGQYEKNQTGDIIGANEEELSYITDEMLAYLKDKRQDFDIKWSEGGNIFNEREIEHMKDVKVLFMNGFKIRNILALIALALFVVIILIYPRTWPRYMPLSYIWTLTATVAFVGLMALFMYKDFDRIWDKFHHIFFTNDLWLLDPDTDVMIMMMPSNFFFSLILNVIKVFCAGAGSLLIASIYLYKESIKRNI